jgi:putative phosphotransacetylase
VKELTPEHDIPIEVSARHIHISEADFLTLFGSGSLSVKRELSQPGQFAAMETLVARNGDRFIDKVRIVGPLRGETQVELSVGDCRTLGIAPHFSISGNLEGSPGIVLEGPRGSLVLDKGVIVPLTHIHMSPREALSLGLAHLDKVTVKVRGERSVSFHDVIIRAREGIDSMALHIDTDQANSVGDIAVAKVETIVLP